MAKDMYVLLLTITRWRFLPFCFILFLDNLTNMNTGFSLLLCLLRLLALLLKPSSVLSKPLPSGIFALDPLSLIGVALLDRNSELFTGMWRVYQWLYQQRKRHLTLSRHINCPESPSVKLDILSPLLVMMGKWWAQSDVCVVLVITVAVSS